MIYPNKEDLVSFDIGNMKVTLGRNPENDICLRDSILSGAHLTISCLAGRLFVEDLGSSNGTIINSTQIKKRSRVFLGDEVTIGEGFFIALDRIYMTNKEIIDNKKPHQGSQPLDIYDKEVSNININQRFGEVKVLTDDEVDNEIMLDFQELSKKIKVVFYKVQYEE